MLPHHTVWMTWGCKFIRGQDAWILQFPAVGGNETVCPWLGIGSGCARLTCNKQAAGEITKWNQEIRRHSSLSPDGREVVGIRIHVRIEPIKGIRGVTVPLLRRLIY